MIYLGRPWFIAFSICGHLFISCYMSNMRLDHHMKAITMSRCAVTFKIDNMSIIAVIGLAPIVRPSVPY